jgi:HSP20 family protein
MSSDEWFKRWGKSMPGPWSYADVEEMMKEMEREFMDIEKIPQNLLGDAEEDDTKEVGSIFYGYSLSVGPDGKPEVKEFGSIRRGPTRAWSESVTDTREPPVDVVEDKDALRVIADMPGADRKNVKLSGKGARLVISAETPARKYRKELNLPAEVDARNAVSRFNNGVLELVLPKKKRGARRSP